MTHKVILDTDIGSDIDDALALAYLLARPDCELLGVTTVSGPVVQRAKMASAMCRLAGRDVPIYPGCSHTLLLGDRQPHAAQAEAVNRWDHQSDFPQGQAISFLRDTIRAHPGQVTLLAIGPMTNVAMLFTIDPEVPKLLKSLVLMCGKFLPGSPGYGPREWNAFCDPHATAAVYQHACPGHRSVGLDVTMQVGRDNEWMLERCTAPLLGPVRDFLEIYARGKPKFYFHDPLAAACIFEPDLCTWRRGRVEVELTGSDRAIGMTHWTTAKPDAGELGPHEIADTVEADRFIEHYFSVFK
jgi:purine nucleosidase